jgi:hypothetical protein
MYLSFASVLAQQGHFGPAPLLRILSFCSLFAFNSAIPALTVFLLHPLILQALAIPPRPNDSASLAKITAFASRSVSAASVLFFLPFAITPPYYCTAYFNTWGK